MMLYSVEFTGLVKRLALYRKDKNLTAYLVQNNLMSW